MKNFLKRSGLLVTSISLILVVFLTGIYLGARSWVSSATVAEQADLTEFWKVWRMLEEKYVPASSTAPLTEQERIWGAIEGLVASYDDPYTVFLTPEENKSFYESLEGEFEGVGMEIGIKDGILTVIAPIKDTPAFRAGIKSGDKIIKIDETSTQDFTVEEAVKLIRGPKGTTVSLTLVRDGAAEPLVIKVTREKIVRPVIESKLREDGIFVINFYSFSEASPRLFKNALKEYIDSGSKKLIVDLRDNPGGYLDASVEIAGWFLPAGKTIVSEDFGNGKDERIFRSDGKDVISDDMKVVVLVNNGSASASEILAGALKGHDVATIIGTKTFGKGSVQEVVRLKNNTSLKVTIARWLTPDGTSISDGGLTPDIEVELKDDVEEGVDQILEKAVEFLKK